jgi:catalase
VFVPGGEKSVETLRKNGRAVHWVREAFGHLKAIGATGEAVQFVRDACDLPGMSFSTSGDVVDSYGVVTAAQVQPDSFKEAIKMAKGAKDFIDAYTYAISQHKNFDRELEGLSSMVAY